MDSSSFACYVTDRNLSNTSVDLFVYDASGTNRTTEDFSITLKPSKRDWNQRRVVKGVAPTCKLSEVQPSGTGGGSCVAGDQTRTLNTISGDTWFITLNSSQFTLQPGEYEVDFFAPAYDCRQTRSYIYNITDASDEILGRGALAESGNQVDAEGFGTIEIASEKTFELRHYTRDVVASIGLGVVNTDGRDNVFSEVKIKKVR